MYMLLKKGYELVFLNLATFLIGMWLNNLWLMQTGILGTIIVGTLVYLLPVKEVKIRVLNLFDDNYSVNEFKKKFKDDPEFAQAVDYIMNLAPKDYMAFNRLIVELRYSNDQSVLKILANQYRRESK